MKDAFFYDLLNSCVRNGHFLIQGIYSSAHCHGIEE